MVVNGRIDERHDITLDPQTEKVFFFFSGSLWRLKAVRCVGWNHWLCACQTESVGVANLAEKHVCFFTERKQLLADDDPSYSVISFNLFLPSTIHIFTISVSVLFMHCLPCVSDTAVLAGAVLNSWIKGITLQLKSLGSVRFFLKEIYTFVQQ